MGNAATDVMWCVSVPAGYLQLIAWGSCQSSSPWLWMETPLSRRSRKPNRKTYWRSRITREQFASGRKFTFRTVYDSYSFFSLFVFPTCALSKSKPPFAACLQKLRIYRVYVMGALPTLRPTGAGISLAWMKFPHGSRWSPPGHSTIPASPTRKPTMLLHGITGWTSNVYAGLLGRCFSAHLWCLGFKAIWSEPKRRMKKWFWA